MGQIGPLDAAGNGCTLHDCGHTVCTACVSTMVTKGIAGGSVTALPCPGCTAAAAQAIIRKQWLKGQAPQRAFWKYLAAKRGGAATSAAAPSPSGAAGPAPAPAASQA